MKNTTVGVDSSTSSLPSKKCPNCDGKGERTFSVPSPTNIADNIEKKEKCDFCDGHGYIYDAGESIKHPHLFSHKDHAEPHEDCEQCAAGHIRTPAENEIYGYIHSSNAQFFMARLLGTVLSQIDASVPNKDQNKAMKHLMRKAFDSAIMDIHGMAWPSLGDPQKDKQSAAMSGAGTLANGYILQPEP